MDAFLAAFEAEFGEITDADIARATKLTRANATVVRSTVPSAAKRARRRSA